MDQVDACQNLADQIVALCLARLRAMGATPEFPGVSRTHWAYDAVQALRDLDILHGYPDGRFLGAP